MVGLGSIGCLCLKLVYGPPILVFGLRELDEISRVAAAAAGWDPDRTRQEAADYLSAIRTRYQIAPPPEGSPG